MKLVLLLALAAMVFTTCKQYRDIGESRTRTLQTSEVRAFHPPLELSIGWVPYEEQKLVKTASNEWKIVKEEPGKQSAVPYILVTYPGGTDSIWIDMNTDNAVLGKLIKHSLMAQAPIQRPYDDFFKMNSCQRCHPPGTSLGF